MSRTLDERMKEFYEFPYRQFLTRRTPIILRIDGKAFHTYTKNYEKPFSDVLNKMFVAATIETLNEIQGSKLAYHQSDEVSILITDYDNLETDAWFGYNIQKMVSVAASIFTIKFNAKFIELPAGGTLLMSKCNQAMFDARVFNIPKEEVCNYFIWRQQDCIRNSVQSLGRANFSQKELQNVSCEQIKEKLITEKQINWETDLSPNFKYGNTIWAKDGFHNPEIQFLNNRTVIESLI